MPANSQLLLAIAFLTHDSHPIRTLDFVPKHCYRNWFIAQTVIYKFCLAKSQPNFNSIYSENNLRIDSFGFWLTKCLKHRETLAMNVSNFTNFKWNSTKLLKYTTILVLLLAIYLAPIADYLISGLKHLPGYYHNPDTTRTPVSLSSLVVVQLYLRIKSSNFKVFKLAKRV